MPNQKSPHYTIFQSFSKYFSYGFSINILKAGQSKFNENMIIVRYLNSRINLFNHGSELA